MHRLIALVICCLLPLASAAAAPQRIVSVAPNITEILYALGLGSRVVGVTTFCHYPPEVLQKPKVGTYLNPSLEQIVALKPDLVIVPSTSGSLQGKLESFRLHTAAISDNNLTEIYQAIERIAQATGVPDRGSKLVQDIKGRLTQIHQRAGKLPRRSVLFVVGRDPNALTGIIAAGRAAYLNEVMEIAGGRNMLPATPGPYPGISVEQVLSLNPQVIIDMGDMSNTVGVTEQHRQSIVNLWRKYPHLNAVRENRVYAIASDVFVVPGPRVVEAAEQFFRYLYPEAR